MPPRMAARSRQRPYEDTKSPNEAHAKSPPNIAMPIVSDRRMPRDCKYHAINVPATSHPLNACNNPKSIIFTSHLFLRFQIVVINRTSYVIDGACRHHSMATHGGILGTLWSQWTMPIATRMMRIADPGWQSVAPRSARDEKRKTGPGTAFFLTRNQHLTGQRNLSCLTKCCPLKYFDL